MDVSPSHRRGQGAPSGAHHQPAREEDAERLAQQQAEGDALGNRVADDRGKRGVEPDSGVGEGEERDNEEGVERRESVRKALERRGRLLPTPITGDDQGEQHPGDGRMHARLKEGQPQREADADVGPERAHAQAVADGAGGEHQRARAEQRPRYLFGVEQCDHQHRAEVVGDGQRGEEDLEPERHAPAEQGEHAERESDVGGHRDAPASRARPASVERHVDPCRHCHPTRRGNERKRRPPGRGQLAMQQLVLYLQPDGEEEQHHQPVIDPMMDRLGEDGAAHAELQFGMPQPLPRCMPGQVGSGHRDDRAQHQQDAGKGFAARQGGELRGHAVAWRIR